MRRVYAWLAQSVEHETLNLRVVGSSPTSGAYHCRLMDQQTMSHLPFISESLLMYTKMCSQLWGDLPLHVHSNVYLEIAKWRRCMPSSA